MSQNAVTPQDPAGNALPQGTVGPNGVTTQNQPVEEKSQELLKQILEFVKKPNEAQGSAENLEKLLVAYRQTVTADTYRAVSAQFQDKLAKVDNLELALQKIQAEKDAEAKKAQDLADAKAKDEAEKKTLSEKYVELKSNVEKYVTDTQQKLLEQQMHIEQQKVVLVKEKLVVAEPIHDFLVPEVTLGDTPESYTAKYKEAVVKFQKIAEDIGKKFQPVGAIQPKGEGHLTTPKQPDFTQVKTKADLERLKDEAFKNYSLG